ncbi:MAG: hypothetical protein V4580_19995 [Bacteroidota bacterium]
MTPEISQAFIERFTKHYNEFSLSNPVVSDLLNDLIVSIRQQDEAVYTDDQSPEMYEGIQNSVQVHLDALLQELKYIFEEMPDELTQNTLKDCFLFKKSLKERTSE